MTTCQQGKSPNSAANGLRLTHSTYWTQQTMGNSSLASSPSQSLDSKDASDGSVTSASSNAGNCDTLPKRVRICDGGFESNEDYTYVRGRGWYFIYLFIYVDFNGQSLNNNIQWEAWVPAEFLSGTGSNC